MDKANVDFEALYRMHQGETYFVTRAKDIMRYEVVSTNYNIDALYGIVGDQVIHLSGYISEKKYLEDLRLVDIRLNENVLQMDKGNLTVKLLWGYSENAVKIHLWVAISAYLLLA